MLEMLSYGFMQRALLAGLIVAVLCPAIGLFLVLRRLAQYGDTFAHVSLAGVAAGLLARFQPFYTAVGFSVIASLTIDWFRRRYSRYSELALAIMAPASLGLAVVLLSMNQGAGSDVLGYLFGAIMTVDEASLYLIGGLGVPVLVMLLVLYKELLSITFDEEHARIGGLPVGLVNSIFMVLTAVTVAMAMNVVGVLLVSGLLVVPVAAALQVARSFRGALVLAILLGLTSVVVGILLSFQLNLAPGGTVVLTAVGLLLLVLAYKQVRGLE